MDGPSYWHSGGGGYGEGLRRLVPLGVPEGKSCPSVQTRALYWTGLQGVRREGHPVS